jgi:hypothetical protein
MDSNNEWTFESYKRWLELGHKVCANTHSDIDERNEWNELDKLHCGYDNQAMICAAYEKLRAEHDNLVDALRNVTSIPMGFAGGPGDNENKK